jgi:Leucine-rich repeat (LRR) protein
MAFPIVFTLFFSLVVFNSCFAEPISTTTPSSTTTDPSKNCPKLLAPCSCNGWSPDDSHPVAWEIECSSLTSQELRQALLNATVDGDGTTSGFSILRVTNITDLEITPDILSKYSFTKIQINNSTIHTLEATPETASEVEEVFIEFSTFLFGDLSSGVKLFKFLSCMPNLKTITIRQTNLKEVPDQAFTTTSSKLSYLKLNKNEIQKIGRESLYELSSLTWIDLSDNKLREVGEKVFSFRDRSEKPLQIDLDKNSLNSQSFNSSSFQLGSRPAVIFLRDNNITVMQEEVFGSIVRSPSVRLFTDGNPLKCYDCSNSWMKKVGQSYEAMNDIVCSETGRSIYELNSHMWSFCRVSSRDVLSSVEHLSSLLKAMGVITPAHSDHLNKLAHDLRDDL